MTAPSGADPLVVRDTIEADIAAITEIYAWHVENGLGTFEEIVPDTPEMTTRWRTVTDKGFPHIVAIDGRGAVVGYAYSGPYRPRSAYRFTAEDSVYVRHGIERRGIGRKLLSEIIDRARKSGVRELVAMIGDTANNGSIKLHKVLGFAHVGVLRNVGFKRGQWADVVLMQLTLTED